MRRVLVLTALLFVFASPAWADVLSGAKAYRSGDYATALTEFRALAARGEPLAQFALGLMHAEGAGVAKDYGAAVEWYRKAAEQGHALAQYNLGVAYYAGVGVPRNYAEAVRWYDKAARQGDARSQNNLGYMYEAGKGVPQDYAMSVQWYRLAAEGGNVNAQVNLGNAYRIGRGVEADHDKAIAWLRKAVDQWDTTDPLKLWIVESPQSIKPTPRPWALPQRSNSPRTRRGPSTRPAWEPTAVADAPASDEAPVEKLDAAPDETAGATVVAEAPQAPVERMVAEAAPAPETASATSKRQYDLIEDDTGGASVVVGFRVQLGAFSNPENAHRGWQQLRDAHPDLLGAMTVDLSLHINKVDLGADMGVVFRVQAGPFAEEYEAQALCSELMNRAVGCFLVTP